MTTIPAPTLAPAHALQIYQRIPSGERDPHGLKVLAAMSSPALMASGLAYHPPTPGEGRWLATMLVGSARLVLWTYRHGRRPGWQNVIAHEAVAPPIQSLINLVPRWVAVEDVGVTIALHRLALELLDPGMLAPIPEA